MAQSSSASINVFFKSPISAHIHGQGHFKRRTLIMNSKKAKQPKAAEPDYVLKPKERDAAVNAMSRIVANTTRPP